MAEVQRDTLGSTEDTLRFLDLIGLFGAQAMMGLGKVANPLTHKAEKTLPAARLFIDTLEMLERKTQGNLTSNETKVLKSTLTDLRLMFVEESNAPAAAPAPEAKAEPVPTDAPPATEPKTSDTPADDSKSKFHKKYE